jgi:hypothetical protein
MKQMFLCMFAGFLLGGEASAAEPALAIGNECMVDGVGDEVLVAAQVQEGADPALLPARVVERTAGKLASPLGALAGGIAGYAVAGVPGLVIGTACGGALMEVVAEFFFSQVLRPGPMPGWQPLFPPIPVPGR